MPDQIEELQEEAIKCLLNFFKGPSALQESPKAVMSSNLAVKSLAAIGRLKATDRARDAMQLTIIKSISENRKQFEKYVRVSMPALTPVKQIAENKKD